MISGDVKLWLMVAVIVYFVVILRFLKNKALELKYTLLWLFAGLVFGILGVSPGILFKAIELVGIQDPMNGIYFIALGLILAILMSITSIVSRQSNKIRRLIQENAILEKRVRDIEEIMHKESEEKL